MPPIRIEERDDRVLITDGDAVLAEYVHRPTDVQLESPRPYLSPIRTLGGELVSLFRPHDHVWHKGIAWSLPVVGDENFWGGPTFVSGQGYVQLAEQRHARRTSRAFEPSDGGCRRGPARTPPASSRRLDWVTEAGETIFEERRTIAATVLDDDAWLLALRDADAQRVGPRHPASARPRPAAARTPATAGCSGADPARSPAAPCSRPASRAATSCAASARPGWASAGGTTAAAAPRRS